MIDYKLDNSYIRNTKGSSLGVQNKYEKDGYWYKQNISGYEGRSEELCSFLLKHSNIEDFVAYEECTINGKSGCRSKNFLSEGEEFITIQRLYEYYRGGLLADKVYSYSDVNDRIDYFLDFLYSSINLDAKKYIQQVLSFDMVVLNVDRHFHNLGLIKNESGYRPAPIFDNGAALFSNYSIFGAYDTIEENLERATARPFSGSFEQQAFAAGLNLELDYETINVALNIKFKDSRAVQVLRHQLERYKNVIPQLSRIKSEIKVPEKEKNKEHASTSIEII